MGKLKALLRWFLAALAVVAVFGSSHQDVALDPTVPMKIPNISDQEAKALLRQFVMESGDNVTESYELMLRVYQRYYGLPETGLLSNETKLTLKSPKCGRVKRSLFTGVSPTVVRILIALAFRSWSAVTILNFEEVQSQGADINIEFGGTLHIGKYGYLCMFEQATTLAHASPPESGSIHFSTRHFFTKIKSLPVFLETAIHEIGHALGLGHNSNPSSIMFPDSQGIFNKPQPIDVRNIRNLYGFRQLSAFTILPTLCTLSKIDAAFKDDLGNLFIFAGDHYFNALTPNSTAQLISTKWPGVPGTVDAAFWYAGRAYFFKNDLFWVYAGSRLVPGRARSISAGFPGLPDGLDAALVVSGDGDGIYAFKRGQYWLYSVREKRVIDAGQMVDIGAPTTHIDAALEAKDGVEIFKGRNTYRWIRGGVTQNKPKSWMQC